jgi:hypothetical protein
MIPVESSKSSCKPIVTPMDSSASMIMSLGISLTFSTVQLQIWKELYGQAEFLMNAEQFFFLSQHERSCYDIFVADFGSSGEMEQYHGRWKLAGAATNPKFQVSGAASLENLRTCLGFFPLHVAAERGNEQMTKFFVSEGAHVDVTVTMRVELECQLSSC